MTDPIQITQKGYWVVEGTNHSAQTEAFQDAGSRAVAVPGTTIHVTPPAFEVVYTEPSPPASDPPPSDPPASPVNAAFTAAVDGATVTIDNQTTGAANQSIDYGDGAVDDTLPFEPYSYSQSGTFAIRLMATGTDGTVSYATQTVTIALPSTPPVQPPGSDLSGQQVTGKVTLSDGTTINVTANPGDVIPLIAGDPTGGALVYHSDGKSAHFVNDYAGATKDLAGHWTLAVGDTVLLDADFTLWARSQVRPCWLAQPALKANPDYSAFAELGDGGESASLYDAYITADNGPMGKGLANPAMHTTGERGELGPTRQCDAIYMKNPTANNAVVMCGMADAAAVWPIHARDFATGKMLSVADSPTASFGQPGPGNPIAAITTACPLDVQQAMSHAVMYCAVACEVRGSVYDREQLAMWANYINSLWVIPNYRNAAGGVSQAHSTTRGKGRGLTLLLYATRYAQDEWKPYFDAMVRATLADYSATFLPQVGIAMDRGNNAYNNGRGFAPWQQDLLTYASGLAIQHGYTDAQGLLDYFGVLTCQRLLDAQSEFATIYSSYFIDDAGNIVADWKASLTVQAAHNTNYAAAVQCATDTAALQTAMGWSGQPGDFAGYPTSPTGYAAIMQPALAMCARYMTDQARVAQAVAVFQQRQRINYAPNPKYNAKLPRAA